MEFKLDGDIERMGATGFRWSLIALHSVTLTQHFIPRPYSLGMEFFAVRRPADVKFPVVGVSLPITWESFWI